MGSGRVPWSEFAEPLGRWIAEAGDSLLTGVGQGVMLEVARAFCGVPNRRGRSIGIVPTPEDSEFGYVPPDGYPNPFIEIPIVTPLPRYQPAVKPGGVTRNYVNILSSDLVITLPGGSVTADEISLAQSFKKPMVSLRQSFERLGSAGSAGRRLLTFRNLSAGGRADVLSREVNCGTTVAPLEG
jgi:predicted Rossmann-fold nucleotide-binding protein